MAAEHDCRIVDAQVLHAGILLVPLPQPDALQTGVEFHGVFNNTAMMYNFDLVLCRPLATGSWS